MLKFVFDWDDGYKMGIVQSDYLDNLREAFSVEDKQASMARYRMSRRYASIRKYAITPNGRFGVGVFPDIYKYLQTLSVPYQCIVTEKFKNNFAPAFLADPDSFNLKELDIPYRPYQEECIKKCLKHGNGVVVVGTAGGKTLIMAGLICNILSLQKGRALVVTSPELVNQAYQDFLDYGTYKYATLARWDGDNEYSPSADIVIASSTILMSKKQDISVLKEFNVILNDECHKTRAGNQINKVLKKVATNHKYGFTGSLPESKIDIWNVMGQLGPIIYEKSREDLQELGYVAPASAVICKITYKNPPVYLKTPSITDPTGMYNEECDFLYKHSFRNRVIGILCKNIDKNTLILVDRLEHQQTLIDEIKRLAPRKNVQFVRGEVEKEAREEIRHIMEKKNNVICIAMASIFATGINIKNIHYLIFAMPGKAKIRILQSIGRGLRLHDQKTKLTIFDIADVLYYGLRHLEHRLELYNEEHISYAIKEIYEKETNQDQGQTQG